MDVRSTKSPTREIFFRTFHTAVPGCMLSVASGVPNGPRQTYGTAAKVCLSDEPRPLAPVARLCCDLSVILLAKQSGLRGQVGW